MARAARSMSRVLWVPRTEAEGIPFAAFRSLIDALRGWRAAHLERVGVPANLQAERWDFVAAVSACSSDATFHVMWIILFNALDDFGIRESREAIRAEMLAAGTPPPSVDE